MLVTVLLQGSAGDLYQFDISCVGDGVVTRLSGRSVSALISVVLVAVLLQGSAGDLYQL